MSLPNPGDIAKQIVPLLKSACQPYDKLKIPEFNEIRFSKRGPLQTWKPSEIKELEDAITTLSVGKAGILSFIKVYSPESIKSLQYDLLWKVIVII